MTYSIFQVDAFANQCFKGNPAAVVPLKDWLTEDALQHIASENNLSETAFFVPDGTDFHLRWFTPVAEVRLCGHATLASAHVLFQHLNFEGDIITFHTLSGPLSVARKENHYLMNFPADPIEKLEEIPLLLMEGLQTEIQEVWKGKDDYLAVLKNEPEVADLKPDFRALAQLGGRGVIASAPGQSTDFVSRCFYPAYGIDEDPVTGSAHTTMTPYWSKKLDKSELTARQISARTGDLICRLQGDRVELEGEAVTFLKGEIYV